MKNVELLSAVSVQSGVASNLSRDLVKIVLQDGEVLRPEHFEKILAIKKRMQAAMSAADALERMAAGGRRNNFWEAEQFQLLKDL